MVIIMLASFLPTTNKGGVGYQIARLAEVLRQRGHDVTVFSFSGPPIGSTFQMKRLSIGEPLCSTAIGKLLAVPVAFALPSYRGYDVIHAHGDSHLLLRREIPVVRTFYGSAREEARHAQRLRRKLSQRVFSVFEGVARATATVTVGISENSQAALGTLDAIIPCGVDRELFRPGPKSEHPSILFVGTLGGRKRGHLVVDAFRQVIQPQIPDCELWLVADQPVAREGIRNWDRPGDAVVADLYRRAWVLVHPSSYEGFGVPYIEAMASGTAIVSTPNSGAAELVADRGVGWIVTPKDLGDSIVRLLRDGPERAQMESVGRTVSERYDWATVASRYEEVYEMAQARKRARKNT